MMEITDRMRSMKFHREGRAVPDGHYNYHGRMVNKSRFQEFYVTKHKRYTPEEWIFEAERIVQEDNLAEIYTSVYNHVKDLPWLKTEQERKEHTLSCMTTESYKHWKKG